MATWPYMVSVRLMTYNHEEYIADSIESILQQVTDFNVELVIGDDFSDDKTLEIIKSYSDTKNIHLKVLKREKGDDYWKERERLGRLYNFTNIISNCSGKYIALLDGDDYWSDPLKLQKQVNILEQHDDVVACHHWQKIRKEQENGVFEIADAPRDGHGYFPETITTVKAIFENKLRIKSRTVLFRNVLDSFPDWFYKVAYGDVPLSFLLGQYGNFYFLNEEMAIYRLTNKGISTKGIDTLPYNVWFEKHQLNWIEIWDYADSLYQTQYAREAYDTIFGFYKSILAKHNYSFSSLLRMLSHRLIYSKATVNKRLKMSVSVIYFVFKRLCYLQLDKFR